MRLRKDASSWRASGLQKKLKQIPDEPIRKAKKNTHKWCKGKVGVLHDYYLIRVDHWDWEPEDGEYRWLHFECANCRKQLYDSIKR